MPRPDTNKNHGFRTSAIEASLVALSEAEEKALAEFDCWMDGELEKLVARWSHLAAPNAAKRGAGRRSF
ncbi:MAG TPA: hypothetical protein VGJ26_22155 [Pirellulales bacterium]|jgi:hypothetical protein